MKSGYSKRRYSPKLTLTFNIHNLLTFYCIFVISVSLVLLPLELHAQDSPTNGRIAIDLSSIEACVTKLAVGKEFCPTELGLSPEGCAELKKVELEKLRNTCTVLGSDFSAVAAQRTAEQLSSSITATGGGIIGLLAAISTIASGFAVHFRRVVFKVQQFADKLEHRFIDPFFGKSVPQNTRAVNLMIIGEGGAGKTTMIHALTSSEHATPAMSTDTFSTYSLVHEVTIKAKGVEKRDLLRIYADDYIGQHFNMGVNNQVLKERHESVKSTVLCIVLDGEKENSSEPYNELVRQTLLDAAGDHCQNIVLFFNKTDALNNSTLRARVKELELGLLKEFEAVRGKMTSLIVGSAKHGTGIVGYDDGNIRDRSLYSIIYNAAKTIE